MPFALSTDTTQLDSDQKWVYSTVDGGRYFSTTHVFYSHKIPLQNHKITKPKLQRSVRRLISEKVSRSFTHFSVILFLGHHKSNLHPLLLLPGQSYTKMVIAAPIACAFNVTSGLIVNGICAYYESIEEEKRMKEQEVALRRSIRLELQRNRMEESQQKRKRQDDDSEIFELCLRAERRRKLIARRIIDSHKKSSENKTEIFRSDSLVDCLDDEDDEGDEKKSPAVEKESSLVPAKLDTIHEKRNVSTENQTEVPQSSSLIDCLEAKENEFGADEENGQAEDDESSLVTVLLDSIEEQENESSESLSLDSIAL